MKLVRTFFVVHLKASPTGLPHTQNQVNKRGKVLEDKAVSKCVQFTFVLKTAQ